ncbi:MAG: competence/damage-inducible protein A [Phaeodactylibacter sp.]|nr:competence/damage-inducible protein A [Phaeodactylibacter sp.]MCB9053039.1 competence/damage-inducible protein A [Lewinellaceae bacterium]
MKVHLITVGDEILIGQITDTNSSWMARQLNLAGARISGITSVGDHEEDIEHVLDEALRQADAVLMTGGLGPTKDDITKKTLAKFFGVELEFHQPTYDRILRFFERLGRTTTPAHRQQCYMPANATLLLNKMGTAPGMWFEQNGKVIVSMPGVPYEMEYLMEHEVIPRMKRFFPGLPIAHRTILTAGEGESRIAERLEQVEDELPPHIKLAYLPNLGQVRLRLSGSLPEEQALNQELDFYAQKITEKLDSLVFGFETDRLEAAVGRLLQEQGKMLVTAESCTGGYLAHLITSIPGSSNYFKGSIIAYSNEVKMNQLKVSPQTLETYGAVSEQTVAEMVKGAVQLLEADVAVAVSGIAGPGGGSPEKPVGTIWIAVGNAERVATQRVYAGKDRLKNIEYSAVHALNFVRHFLLQEQEALRK